MARVSIPSDWIGQLVEIGFLDHQKNDNSTDVVNCRVWGKLLSVTARCVVVQQWETDGSSTDNTENAALVRITIHSARLLRYAK